MRLNPDSGKTRAVRSRLLFESNWESTAIILRFVGAYRAALTWLCPPGERGGKQTRARPSGPAQSTPLSGRTAPRGAAPSAPRLPGCHWRPRPCRPEGRPRRRSLFWCRRRGSVSRGELGVRCWVRTVCRSWFSRPQPQVGRCAWERSPHTLPCSRSLGAPGGHRGPRDPSRPDVRVSGRRPELPGERGKQRGRLGGAASPRPRRSAAGHLSGLPPALGMFLLVTEGAGLTTGFWQHCAAREALETAVWVQIPTALPGPGTLARHSASVGLRFFKCKMGK